MVKTGINYIFLFRSNKEQTENKGKTWSRGTNSRLLFGVNVNVFRSNKEQTENKEKTWSRGTNSRLLFGVNVNHVICLTSARMLSN